MKDTADGAKEALDFVSDPIGYLAEKTQDGARSLAENVLPAMAKAMEPDLTADWFLEAYKITFALAIFAWVGQLIYGLLQTSRHKTSASEMVDIIVARSPIFLLGCMFGPAIGGLFIRFFGALTNDIIKGTVGGSVDSVGDGVTGLVGTGDPGKVAGGAFVALIIYLVMIIGLLICLLTMIVMLVTLYLSGVMFPLAFQYLTSPTQKDRAWTVARIWLGILLSHPLMFLLLGFSLKMASGTLLEGQLPGEGTGAPQGLRLLAGLLMCAVALWMTALSPLALSKLAPVLPTGAGTGDGVDAKSLPLPGTGQSKAGSNGMARTTGAQGMGGGGLDAESGGGGGGGGDAVLASVGGGGGGSAASSGAAAGAEKAGMAGAETGPLDLAIAGAGALAGAAGGALKDGMDEASAQAGSAGSGGGSDAAATTGNGNGNDNAQGGDTDGGSGLGGTAGGLDADSDVGGSGGGGADLGGDVSGDAGTPASGPAPGEPSGSDPGNRFAPAEGDSGPSNGASDGSGDRSDDGSDNGSVADLSSPDPSQRTSGGGGGGARRAGTALGSMLDDMASAATTQAESHGGHRGPGSGGQGGGSR